MTNELTTWKDMILSTEVNLYLINNYSDESLSVLNFSQEAFDVRFIPFGYRTAAEFYLKEELSKNKKLILTSLKNHTDTKIVSGEQRYESTIPFKELEFFNFKDDTGRRFYISNKFFKDYGKYIDNLSIDITRLNVDSMLILLFNFYYYEIKNDGKKK